MKFLKKIQCLTTCMISNQEDFTIPIEDISPKQLDNFNRKRDESLYNNESLTTIRAAHPKVNLPGRNLSEGNDI